MYLKMVNAMISNTFAYKFVEFLQNTTTQWFDLQIPASLDYGFRMKVNVYQGTGNEAFFGEVVNPYRFGFALQTNSNALTFYSNNAWTTNYVNYKPLLGVTYIIKFNYLKSNAMRLEDEYGELLGNERNFGTINNPILASISMRLFSLGGTNVVYQYGTIYSLEITHNNEIIHDYKPAVRRSDGVAGLYDTITGNFLINAGTGSFIVGPDI